MQLRLLGQTLQLCSLERCHAALSRADMQPATKSDMLNLSRHKLAAQAAVVLGDAAPPLLLLHISENETPSSVWRPVALTLLTLCLVLLVGLAALGLVFFQFYQLSNIQQDSIAEKDERLGNVSRQLQSLQMQNRRLIETLQHVAVKLCRELYNKSGGHRCSPCPESWKWHGDKCYQFYKESRNWQGCEYFCLAENATMLKISTQEELDFAMPQSYSEFFYSYWTGLSRNGSGKAWLWTDGTPYSFELFEIIIDPTNLRNRDCMTIFNGKAFSKDCKELRRCACERMAGRVVPEVLQ